MTVQYLGQITMCGFGFAPKGWALCNGQLLSIQQNTALFALLGTFYGGNGTTNFALPNLQSQLPVHQGQGNGLSPYVIGQAGGAANVTILQTQMPQHNHTLNATQTIATTATISTGVLPGQPTVAQTGASPAFYANPTPVAPTPNVLAPGVCSVAGSSQAHSNQMPSLCITFVIALTGIFPTRN
jgi:microcystin-dependent protein